MSRWTAIRHKALEKIHGGPVRFEKRLRGRMFPERVTMRDQKIFVRVIKDFVELKSDVETLCFYQPSTVREIAAALIQSAEVLESAMTAGARRP